MSPQSASTGRPVLNIIVGVFVAAVLLGLLLPGGSRVGNAARKSMAMNDVTQLCYVVRAFHTDYGVYPIDPSVHWKDRSTYDLPAGEHHNFELINTLRADGIDPGPNYRNALNTHETLYLDVPYVKDAAYPMTGLGNGNETDGRNIKTSGEWYDPWGNPYICVIDPTGEKISNLGFIYSDLTAPNSIQPSIDVIAISFGRDGKQGSGGNGVYAGSDDVVGHVADQQLYPQPSGH